MKNFFLDQTGLGHVLLSLQECVAGFAKKSESAMLLCGIYESGKWKAYKYDENGKPTNIEIQLHRVLETSGNPAAETPLIAMMVNGKIIAVPMVGGTASGNGSNGGSENGSGDGEEGNVPFPGLWWLLYRTQLGIPDSFERKC
jgi:hypothetical protein